MTRIDHIHEAHRPPTVGLTFARWRTVETGRSAGALEDVSTGSKSTSAQRRKMASPRTAHGIGQLVLGGGLFPPSGRAVNLLPRRCEAIEKRAEIFAGASWWLIAAAASVGQLLLRIPNRLEQAIG